MNKYEEAMNYLWNLHKVLQYDENKSREYLEVLQELVEKETPKKPEIKELIRKDNYRDGRNIHRYDWWCPNCYLEHMSGNDLKYCPSCGQALDWEM